MPRDVLTQIWTARASVPFRVWQPMLIVVCRTKANKQWHLTGRGVLRWFCIEFLLSTELTFLKVVEKMQLNLEFNRLPRRALYQCALKWCTPLKSLSKLVVLSGRITVKQIFIPWDNSCSGGGTLGVCVFQRRTRDPDQSAAQRTTNICQRHTYTETNTNIRGKVQAERHTDPHTHVQVLVEVSSGGDGNICTVGNYLEEVSTD